MCGGGGGIGRAISGAVKGVVGAVKSVAKSPIFQAIAPLALNAFFPGAGLALAGTLGVGASWAPMLMGAVTGGGMGLISGKGIGGALKGAAIGAAASGIGDYLSTGNNPFSGMFSGGAEGAGSAAANAASNPLTGAGSGLGAPDANAAINVDPFGGFPTNTPTPPTVNPNAPISPTPPTQPKGFLNNLKSGNVLGAAKSLIPESTAGKVALGGLGLSLLGGGGPQPQPQNVAAPQQDPSFTQRLPQYNYNANLQNTDRNLNVYGQGSRAYDASRNQWVEQNPTGEQQFFRPTYTAAADPNTPIDPRTGQPIQNTRQAARGGLMRYHDYHNSNRLNYAAGGMMPGYQEGGLLHDPSPQASGISDTIPAQIGEGPNARPARLSAGEFLIPSRIVSEIGMGSSEIGSRKLMAMIDRIDKARRNLKDYASDSHADEMLPA